MNVGRVTGLKAIIFEEDPLTAAIRGVVRSTIDKLQAVLGAGPYQRTDGRQGFERRQFSTFFGKTDLKLPRGRLF